MNICTITTVSTQPLLISLHPQHLPYPKCVFVQCVCFEVSEVFTKKGGGGGLRALSVEAAYDEDERQGRGGRNDTLQTETKSKFLCLRQYLMT